MKEDYQDDVNQYQPESREGWGYDDGGDPDAQPEVEYVITMCDVCGEVKPCIDHRGTFYATAVCDDCMND